MAPIILAKILRLEGQAIKDVVLDQTIVPVRMVCRCERRRRPGGAPHGPPARIRHGAPVVGYARAPPSGTGRAR